MVTSNQVEDIQAVLASVAVRAKEVQENASLGFTCEDSRLLEVALEHILFHWDDIVAVLLDELICEEVLELN